METKLRVEFTERVEDDGTVVKARGTVTRVWQNGIYITIVTTDERTFVRHINRVTVLS